MGWFTDNGIAARQAVGRVSAQPTTQPVGGGIQAPVEPQPTDRSTLPVGQPQLPPGEAPAAGDQDIQALVQQYMAGKGSGPEVMQGLQQFLASKGINVTIPTRGDGVTLSSDKIVLPNQQVVDLLGDEGGANRFQWSEDGFWVDGKPSSTPGTWSDPNAGEFGGQFGGGMGTLGQFTGGGQYPLASYRGQGLLAPWESAFNRPDLNDTTDPGYHARFNLGKEAMEASAAAKGTLLTGGFQKDLNQFAQDYASNEYDKIYGRSRNEYLDAYNIYRGNANDQYNRLFNFSQLGLNATNQLGGAGSSYANNASNLYTGIGNAQAAGTVGAANAQGNALGALGQTAATLGAYWGTGGPSGSQTSAVPGMTPPYNPRAGGFNAYGGSDGTT
jgi:hypothetical protein